MSDSARVVAAVAGAMVKRWCERIDGRNRGLAGDDVAGRVPRLSFLARGRPVGCWV